MSDDRVADARFWLDIAREDLTASRARPGRHFRPRHVANLAQQAAEKALKAAVVRAVEHDFARHADLEVNGG